MATKGEEFTSKLSDVELANDALRKLNAVLHASKGGSVPVSVAGSSDTIELPRSVASTLRSILANTAAGQTVTVVPTHAELTTQQAADFLNVSRPFLIKLLESKQIAYRKVGTHRRITADSLAEYKRKMDIESRQSVDELTELSEDLGLYE